MIAAKARDHFVASSYEASDLDRIFIRFCSGEAQKALYQTLEGITWRDARKAFTELGLFFVNERRLRYTSVVRLFTKRFAIYFMFVAIARFIDMAVEVESAMPIEIGKLHSFCFSDVLWSCSALGGPWKEHILLLLFEQEIANLVVHRIHPRISKARGAF